MKEIFTTENPFDSWILTGFEGKKALLYTSLESTHTLMKNLANKGEIEPGTLIVANAQTKGKGRHLRSWVSPINKNLYFNILISLDKIPLNNAPQLTQVAAITMAEIFSHLQDSSKTKKQTLGKITVKWPNDILCGKHKFCGILAELIYIKNSKQNNISILPAMNLGVGINVNSESYDYSDLNREVTTLKDITGVSLNREKLLQIIVANLERAVGQFKAFGMTPWVNAWKKMDKFIGQSGTIVIRNLCTDKNQNSNTDVIKKRGVILDIKNDGSLLFKCEDGTIENVYSADLEI